jgi:hypothetical protein
MELIPFGKYKGQPLEQLQNDPRYAQWLLEQSWFAQRYGKIKTLIVNNFKEVTDSPVHNEMQARFLDPSFAFFVCNALAYKPFEWWVKNKLEPFRLNENLERVHERGKFGTKFEVRGWDVVVHASYWASGNYKTGYRNPDRFSDTGEDIEWSIESLIELKPSMGEDFPSVLRQVKSRKTPYSGGTSCVLIDEFVAESVSFEMVQKMFLSSDVDLLMCRELQSCDVPEWVAPAEGDGNE